MNSKVKDKSVETLFEAILSIKNIEECELFFEDLCTINEIKSMSQRLEVAMLLKKNVVYSEIAHITGASSATISRVSKCLNYGNDGYNLVLERLKDFNNV